MRKFVLKFGLIAGLILSVTMIGFLMFQGAIGFEHSHLWGYGTMVLAFLMVYFGVKAYRDEEAGGSIGFWRAFQVGLLITLVGTACYVATWQIAGPALAPDFMEKYVDYTLAEARKKGATEAQIEQQRKDMDAFMVMYRKPLVNIAFTTLEPLPVGLVFTLVAAGVLSRRRRETIVAA